MSVTIDSLDIQIRSSAGSAAANIDALAASLVRLKSASNLTKVANNLNKLANALDSLRNANMSSLNELASAMSSLSGVQRLSGLNSAFNTLKKLPEVIAGLDAADLATFASQMERLADALSPLAEKIDRIAAGFARLPTQVSRTVTAVNRLESSSRRAAQAQDDHRESINTTSLNLATITANIQAYMGVLEVVKQKITAFIADAIEWDGIQFRFGRAFGEDAEETYAYILKISDALQINTQQFMQYSSLYGSLLSGFGMAQEKVTAISIGLTELSYDIWAAHNDRFKTLEDASEAVRSAITGEIEPIRNAGIALTEASMQEYLDSIGQAHVSVEKLTEAQKSEVRYAVMVNAAMNQGIVGTYAAEMHTAEGEVRTLAQQMKGLSQAIGSLFLPILTTVIPWITAFVSVLYDAAAAVAAVFGIPFFKINWAGTGAGVGSMTEGVDALADSAGGAGKALGAAGSAAKKLKDYTMGFDELNVIDTSAANSGGSGGAGGAGGAGGGIGGNGWEGLDLDTLWDDSIFDKASKKTDALKAKIQGFFDEWKTEIAIISAALGTLAVTALLSQLGEALVFGDKFMGVLGGIKKAASTAIVITLQYSFMTAFLDSFLDGEGFKNYLLALITGAIGTGILYSMWGPTGIVIGLGVTAVASLSALLENGGINSAEGVLVGLTGIAAAIASITVAWKKFAPLIKASNLAVLVGWLMEGGNAGTVFALAFPKLTEALSKFGGIISGVLGDIGAFFTLLGEGNGFGATLAAAFPKAADAIAKFIAIVTGGTFLTVAAIVAAIASAAYFLYENWDKVVEAAKNFVKTNIAPKLEDMSESWEKIKDAVAPLGDLFSKAWKHVQPFFEGIVKFAKDIDFGWIADGFEILGGVIFGVVSGVIAGAFSSFVKFIEGFVQVISGIVEIVSGVVKAVVAIFSGDLPAAGEAVKMIGDGIVDVFYGLWDATVGAVVAFVEGVIDWFTELWDELVGHSIVPDMIDAIVEWFTSLPDKIFGSIEAFCKGILDYFKGLWSDITSWWNSYVAPKFTKAYWDTKFDVIRAAIATKLDAAKAVMSEKWTLIKDWFTKNVAPKFTLAYWQTKFDTIKAAIATKLDEFKTILSTKWGEIKDWYNKNVAPKFTLDFWLTKFQNLKNGFTQTIKNMLNAGIDMINRFIGWLNDKMRFSWDAVTVAGKEIVPSGSVQLFTIPKITQRFADGGFIEDGLFTMNHGEIAGRFSNGKSVVANNQQIVDGISEGVYRAVVAAMAERSSGGDQSFNIYLDGKKITASVEKTQRERGRQILAGGMI